MKPRAIWRAIRLLLSPASVEREVDDELQAHLDLQARHHQQAGMARDAAVHAAEQEFGIFGVAKQSVLSVHADGGAGWPDALASDLRFTLRSLRQHRMFSGITALVLALGIGAATLIFSVVSGVLLRPLPFHAPDRIVMIWGDYALAGLAGIPEPIAGRQIVLMRQQLPHFEHVSGFVERQMNLGGTGSPQRIDGAAVNDDFFETIGVKPQLGRGFRPGEDLPSGGHVAVLSWSLWQRVFGGDPKLVGRTIVLNGDSYTVVGIAPPDFAFPRGSEMPNTFRMPAATELWIAEQPPLRGPSEAAVVGRLKDNATLAQASADLANSARELEQQFPRGKGWFNARLVPLRTQMVGDVRSMLLLLLGAVAVLLLIACVNAAQLFTARLQGRRGELAIRAALGASTARVARVLLLEAVLLTGAAGVLGIACGAVAVSVVRRAASATIPRLAEVTFDWRAIIAAIVITVVAGVVFGIAPATSARRMRLADALRRSGRRGQSDSSATVRRALIVAEIALSVVLVSCAGLLVRSLSQQLNGDLGFSAPHAVTFEVSLPTLTYPETQGPTWMEHARGVEFIDAALTQLRAIPGISAAAIGKPLPMSGAEESTAFTAEQADPQVLPSRPIEYTIASPQMFAALGTPIISGRDFNGADRLTSVPVTVITASAAKWLWPGQDPIGKRIHLGPNGSGAPWMTVIGVVADIHRYSLTKDPDPELFVPYTQNPYPTFSSMQFVVRSAQDPAMLAEPIRRAIAAVDPAVPVARLRTVDDLVRDVSANARLATLAMSAFGGAALLLAMVGLYGLIAYMVALRRREFGLRSALGATRGRIVNMVLREGMTLVSAGLVVGMVLSALLSRLLDSMLYHVARLDPLTAVTTVALLVLATALACVIPARRAAAVDPRVALDAG